MTGERSNGARRAYQGTVRLFSLAFIVLGIVILAMTLASGGGALSIGIVMGIAFLAVGAGRLWVASRMHT